MLKHGQEIKDAISYIGEAISEGGCEVRVIKYEEDSLVVMVDEELFRLEVLLVTKPEAKILLKEIQ